MTIIREDLVTACPACGGTGEIPTTPIAPNGWRQGGPCQRCVRGEVPTETGKAVLDFVQKFKDFRR